MNKKDIYAKARAYWQNKLIKGEISVEEYNAVNPRIRMAPDGGDVSDEDLLKSQPKSRK